MVKIYIKYQINVCKHDEKKCGKLICRTDGRTECKPKVPFDFVGWGLKNNQLNYHWEFNKDTRVIDYLPVKFLKKNVKKYFHYYTFYIFSLTSKQPVRFLSVMIGQRKSTPTFVQLNVCISTGSLTFELKSPLLTT